MAPSDFFLKLVLKLVSPKVLVGIFPGLGIGLLTVWVSAYIFRNGGQYDGIAQFLGGVIAGLYGYWFAGKNSGWNKFWGTFLFLILSWLAMGRARGIIESLFQLAPDSLNDNFISYAISCGFSLILAGAVFETFTFKGSQVKLKKDTAS